MNCDIPYCLELFRVTKADLQKVTATAMKNGASYADLYFEHTTYRDLLLREGQVSSGGFHTDFGVGIRALDGDRTGYSYCETTDITSMLQAARTAASISTRLSCSRSVMTPAPSSLPSSDHYPVTQPWNDVSNNSIIALMLKLQDKLTDKDSRILKIIAHCSSSDSYVMMYNSFGELVCDFRPMGSITVSIIFAAGGDGITENRTVSRSFRKGFEMMSESILNAMVDELVRGIDPMLQAGRPKGGKMPVVMAPGASGILLHEAMGHAFEADFNRKGQSIFSDKMGKRICPRGINVVDDATLEGNRGSCNFDDEGVVGQKTYMVADGVLNSYLHDRISAAHYGVPPTGNGRRESFRFNPIPRMRLTYMEAGDASEESMISSVTDGIYVKEFSNGQVDIGQGDFTFYVNLGYLIENGKLTRPVKDINIIGNGPRALSEIKAVGEAAVIDNGTWTCGKDQNVPVGCGTPALLIEGLTVGGE